MKGVIRSFYRLLFSGHVVLRRHLSGMSDDSDDDDTEARNALKGLVNNVRICPVLLLGLG